MLRQSRSLSEQLALHDEVLSLRRGSCSYGQIIKQIEQRHGVRLPKSTVSVWVRGKHLPQGRAYRFEAKASPELAYVIGVVAGDGSLNVREYAYRVRLQATDLEFVQEFDRCLYKLLGSKPHNVWRGAGRNEYHVEAASFLLHQFLRTPAIKLGSFIEHDETCVSSFLRGFFDSEGCVLKSRVISASNTNRPILEYIQKLLIHWFGIRSRGPYISSRKGSKIFCRERMYLRKSDCFQIVIWPESSEVFRSRIGFTIRRKRDRLQSEVQPNFTSSR